MLLKRCWINGKDKVDVHLDLASIELLLKYSMYNIQRVKYAGKLHDVMISYRQWKDNPSIRMPIEYQQTPWNNMTFYPRVESRLWYPPGSEMQDGNEESRTLF